MFPKLLKPATVDEETFVSNRRTPRGDWRWRVRKEKSRNLRNPNRLHGHVRESDVPIVVKKQGSATITSRRKCA
jgi:hypothetical protein